MMRRWAIIALMLLGTLGAARAAVPTAPATRPSNAPAPVGVNELR